MLPHITNSAAGVNRMDPVHSNLFEVYFTVPAALREKYGKDEEILTQQILSIDGIGSLDKGPTKVEQKFMGTTRSYLAPKLESTSHELTCKFELNLRNRTDNFIYKLFKEWNQLCYDMTTGETVIKEDYVADWLRVCIGNRAGEIYRDILFKDVILVEGLDVSWGTLDYATNDPVQLTVKFSSDWAEDLNV